MQKILNENLVYQNKNGIEYIQFKKLLQYPEITHCYTLRSNNKLDFPPVYKDAKTLKQSYKKIANAERPDRILVKEVLKHSVGVRKSAISWLADVICADGTRPKAGTGLLQGIWLLETKDGSCSFENGAVIKMDNDLGLLIEGGK